MGSIGVIIENIYKKFNGETVLSNINVQFEPGKIHGVVGRNGSGKSVLFKIICGLILPTSGNVIIDGKKIGKDIDFPQDAGIIIETPGFLPNMSGYKNLKLLASLKGVIDDEVIKSSISRLGLDPLSKKHVGKYSLGMKQRLALAQAIMEDPKLLILDEPMNGLDRQGANDVRDLLLALKEEGKTLIISSHNAEDIKLLCNTVIELDNGKVIMAT